MAAKRRTEEGQGRKEPHVVVKAKRREQRRQTTFCEHRTGAGVDRKPSGEKESSINNNK